MLNMPDLKNISSHETCDLALYATQLLTNELFDLALVTGQEGLHRCVLAANLTCRWLFEPATQFVSGVFGKESYHQLLFFGEVGHMDSCANLLCKG